MLEDMKEKVLIGPKDREELVKELGEAVRRDDNKAMEQALESAMAKKEEKEEDDAGGKGLELDPEFFVKFGSIKKENIRVLDGLVVDMQTLTQKQRLLAEMLVKARFKTMAQDNVYTVAIEAAILAVAITKANNVAYPIPNVVAVDTKDPAYLAALEGKAKLFDTLLDASSELITLMSLIYSKLESADALIVRGEPAGKK